MKRAIMTPTIAALAALVMAAGCGTKQPAPEDLPPEPVLPKAATCPGALPGTNVQISTAIGESSSPVIAWMGDAFALAWWDLRGRFPQVYTVRVDRNGTPRSQSFQVPNRGAARDQSLAWDGEDLHLVFRDDEQIMATRFGAVEEPPRVIAEEGKDPAAGAWGAVAWQIGGNLLFRCDGMKEGVRGDEEPRPALVATGGIETPQIAFNGRIYAVVWSTSAPGGREIVMQRMSPEGRKVGPPVKVSATAGVSRKPTVVSTGDAFAVAWTNAAPQEQNPKDRYRVFFAVVPEEGATPSMTRQLDFQGSADQVALAFTGKEFGLSWVGSREPQGTAVYLQRIGLDGVPLGDTTEVTDGVPLTCGRPSIAWDGEGYGVAWHDDRAQTGAEVFFAYVECGEEPPEIVAPPEPEAEPEPAGPGAPPELKESFDEDGAATKEKRDAPADEPEK
jgi:hypothetical protein